MPPTAACEADTSALCTREHMLDVVRFVLGACRNCEDAYGPRDTQTMQAALLSYFRSMFRHERMCLDAVHSSGREHVQEALWACGVAVQAPQVVWDFVMCCVLLHSSNAPSFLRSGTLSYACDWRGAMAAYRKADARAALRRVRAVEYGRFSSAMTFPPSPSERRERAVQERAAALVREIRVARDEAARDPRAMFERTLELFRKLVLEATHVHCSVSNVMEENAGWIFDNAVRALRDGIANQDSIQNAERIPKPSRKQAEAACGLCQNVGDDAGP